MAAIGLNFPEVIMERKVNEKDRLEHELARLEERIARSMAQPRAHEAKITGLWKERAEKLRARLAGLKENSGG